ncbi:MAG: hypothetical protein GX963_08820 [Bacteroidales bacterium]|nr:hypothetical protein [Bacteroidales bacterium]
MRKVFYLLMLTLVLFSCSDNKDEEPSTKDFKTVKVVITRESNDLSKFWLNTVFTLKNDKENHLFNEKDFDLILPDETNLLLYKKHSVLTNRYEAEIKLRKVDIQVLENPLILDEAKVEDESKMTFDTKIEIFVNGKLKKSQSFTFDYTTANLNIVQYSE